MTETTALVGTALLISPLAARAANITISAGTNATQVLGAGDSLTVTNTGSITNANPAVSVSGVSAVSVTNQGQISGVSTGIIIHSSGQLTGGIDNSGTIQGGLFGVVVEGDASDVSGGIKNSGSITGGFTEIWVLSDGNISGGIKNSGTIAGVHGEGVRVEGGGDISGGIDNSGTISNLFAVRVLSGGDISGGVVNEAGGVIAGKFEGITVQNTSDISGGIDNSGTISGADTAGILVFSNSNISGAVVNSGTITGKFSGVFVLRNANISGGIVNNAGGTIHGGSGGILVQNTSDISGGITNSGTISGNTGIRVSNNSAISGGITNSGVIEGTGGTAISLNGLSASTPITINGGRIVGDVIDDTPANGFSPVTVGGDFTSQGNFSVSSFSVSPGVAFTFGAGNTITSNSAVSDDGTILISAAGSSITGGLKVNPGGILTAGSDFAVNGALTNDGTITVDNGRVLTATTFTGSSGSALDVQVGRSAGTLTGGELVATGSAVDLTNTALAISIVAGSQPLVNGSTVVIANGNAAGSAPVAAVRDNSFIYDFSVNPSAGNNLTLTVNQTSCGAATTNSNNANVCPVLLAGLASSTNPQINAIQNKLIHDTSRASFNHDLEAATPTVDGSGRTAALDVSENVLGLLGERLTALRAGEDSGMSAGDGYTRGKDNDRASLLGQAKPVLPPAAQPGRGGDATGQSQAAEPPPDERWRGALRPATMVWAEAFGQHSSQAERDNIAGYHANTWGGAAGMDTRNIADDVVAGVAVSYGRTDARSNNANATDTGVDSYQLTLYGDYDPKGETYIDGMVAYSFNRNETTRHDVGGVAGLTAHGHDDADQVTAQVEAGHEYAAGETILTPDIMARGVWYNAQSYTESGAGGADLNVSGNSQSLFELGAGVKAGWIIGESDGSIIKPQVRAGYRYAVVDDRIEDTASFTGGGAFTTQGPTPSRSSVNLGGTLRYYTPTNWNFTASYDFDWKSDYTSNAGYLKAGYRF